MTQPPTALRLSELPTHGAWEELDAGAQLEIGYRAVTDWKGGSASAGLSIVVARLAFTRGGRPLPPGGVLLGIDLVSYSSPPNDGRFEYLVTTEVIPHRSGKPPLRASTRLRVPEGRHVADVTFAIRWPGA